MNIRKKWMDEWERTARETAVEITAEKLYMCGFTAEDIRMNNVENSLFYEQVADYMDYMQDMEDGADAN